jgi:ribosomal protein S18 acetylase RimI-like enzyme
MLRKIEENLGLVSDLLLHAQVGSVTHDDPYLVMRTPEAPDYFSGNTLVLERRPLHKERERLEDDFAQRIGMPPAVSHRSFAWPEKTADKIDLDAYVAHGYTASIHSVLVAERDTMRPSPTNDTVQVRLFESDRDWDAWARIALAELPETASGTSRRCVEFQRAAYRRLIDKQFGNWWGAFIDDELVGSLGLFFFGSIGRFQSIVTREDHRNKRVCRTLLTEVVKRTAGARDRLVIVADEAHHAMKLYESLGFVRQARTGNLCQSPS